MPQDNPYALERGITVSREPSAPSAPPAPDGGDDDVLELRARLLEATKHLQDYQKVLERYRSDLKQRDAELKQKAAELKQCEDECNYLHKWYRQKSDELEQTNISYTVQQKTLDELKQKQHETMRKSMRLQDGVNHWQMHVGERTAELAKVDQENVSLRHELSNTKAEVEKLQKRMREWSVPEFARMGLSITTGQCHK
jgi:chromosome segregation ATPase